MAKFASLKRQAGFSLVELMVVLVFTGVLMAGLASVFKGSTKIFSSSGEVLSSARRSRMAVDLLTEDLNSAGMFLSDLSNPPTGMTLDYPAFFILPNMPVTGASSEDPGTADELYFYRDEPLPFEGVLTAAGTSTDSARNANELVLAGAAQAASDRTYKVDCLDQAYATMLANYLSTSGDPNIVNIIFKDSWQTFRLKRGPTVSGTEVTVVLEDDPDSAITGVGSADAPPKAKHILQSGVLFFRPAQMIKYSIKMKMLDPLKASGVPCLVREQAVYDGKEFPIVTTQETIVTENVSGFKVYLSADSGQNWVGYQKDDYKGKDGWKSIRAGIDGQVATTGRANVTTTAGNETWFRDIPALVRVDITTRTAAKRVEFSANPATAPAYRSVTQSLVIVPRHFGLPLK